MPEARVHLPKRSELCQPRGILQEICGLTTPCGRLSREEREEAYNKARERIFGSSVQTETTTPGKWMNSGLFHFTF